ncbi:MAG: hypothetical protein RQ842_05730 [Vulcanisaeta sp.]|jgi:hypothetical protein|nr:hypothetical protein [Vulcanisaeta sp.]
MVGIILQAGGISGYIAQVANPIIGGAVDVLGWIWWFNFITFMYHIIMSKVHPTPSGRGTHTHEAFEHVKRVVSGIGWAYAAIATIIAIIGIFGGGAPSALDLFKFFFVKPITDAITGILGT